MLSRVSVCFYVPGTRVACYYESEVGDVEGTISPVLTLPEHNPPKCGLRGLFCGRVFPSNKSIMQS